MNTKIILSRPTGPQFPGWPYYAPLAGYEGHILDQNLGAIRSFMRSMATHALAKTIEYPSRTRASPSSARFFARNAIVIFV